MSNFVNQINLPSINQYEDIINTITQARKLMMEPTGNNARDNLAAASYVERSLSASGWNEASQGRKAELITNLAATTKRALTNYLDDEDPSMTTENAIRNLISDIDNFLNNFINTNDIGAAEAAGGRRRKSRRYKKSRKSKKTKRSKKTRKSRKY
jgi:hypothetical protein